MDERGAGKPGGLFRVVFIFCLVAASVLSLVTGAVHDPPSWVIMDMRLPRLVLGLLTGAALAVSGCVLQAILRNDLATPYTLGISAGAGVTAGAVIVSGLMVPALGMVLLGTAGALLSVAVVYSLAVGSGRGDLGSSLVLAGVTMNLVGASFLLLLEYFSGASRMMEIVRWMMGDLAVVGWSKPLFLALPVVLGLIVVAARTGVMNQLSVGDDIAYSRGVSVRSEKNVLLASAALLAGSTVGTVGPVGFVGLMVPHIMRTFVGSDYRKLVPASAVGGMLLVILADTLSRVLVSPGELPVGIVMSVAGGTFFMMLLLGGRR